MKKLKMKHLFSISFLIITNVRAGVSELRENDCSKNTFTGIQLVNARFSSPGEDLKGEYTRLPHNVQMSSEYAELKFQFHNAILFETKKSCHSKSRNVLQKF